MAMNAMGAGFVVTAKDAASAVFGRIGRSMGGLTKTAKTSLEKMNMGAGASLGAMGGGMVAAGSAMLNLSANLAEGASVIDRNLGRVAGRVGGSAEAMSDLRSRLTGPEFVDLHQDVNQITGSFARLVEETGSADEAMKQLRPSMELATAAGLENELAAGLLSDTLAQFNLTGDDAAATADKLAATMNKAGILGSELEPMLAGTASGAALANQGLDDTLLAAGLIKARFPAAGKAAAALNMAMIQLSDPKVQQEIKAQGVAVRDNAGKIRPVVDVMGELAERTAGMTEAQRAQTMASVFGGRAAGGLSVIMDTLAEGVQNAEGETVKGAAAAATLRAELKGSTGAAKAMAKAMKDNYVGATERATKAGLRWATTWGEGAQSLRRPFLEAKAAALESFSTLLQGTDVNTRRNILGVVTALGGLTKSVGALVVGMGAMKMFGISFTDLIFTFAKAILIIGPLVLLLGGLAIGLYAVYRSVNQNASGVGDSFKDMAAKVKLGWTAVIELITRGDLSRATQRELNKTKNAGVLGFVRGFERFLERMKAFWKGLVRGFDIGAARLAPGTRLMIERFKSIFSIFTGEENGAKVLEEWGTKGESAGIKLAGMGETALKVLNKIADVAKIVVEWLGELTADDIADGIDGLVATFDGLAKSLETVASVFSVVAWIIDFVWHTIRVVTALIVDVIGNMVDTISHAWDFLFGDKTAKQEAGMWFAMRSQEGFKELMPATTEAAGEYSRDVFGMENTVGMSEEEKKKYYAKVNRAQINDLRQQQESIAAYMATTGDQWAAGVRPMNAGAAFGSLDAKTQQEWMDVFNGMSKVIQDLGGKPVQLYVDGEKMAETVLGSGAGQGTRSLDEGDAVF